MLVVLYCVGMAFLIEGHGATSPAPLVALGMYSAYCGALMTPMTAN